MTGQTTKSVNTYETVLNHSCILHGVCVDHLHTLLRTVALKPYKGWQGDGSLGISISTPTFAEPSPPLYYLTGCFNIVKLYPFICTGSCPVAIQQTVQECGPWFKLC